MLNAIRLAASGGGGGGAGTVTSVGFTGGLISVANPTGAAALTVAGTSGGIPYFGSTSSWASSGLLAANALLIGGGAGAAPASTTTGTGVLTALGVAVGSAGAFVVNGGALGTPSSGTLTNCTGIPAAGITGTLAATNGGTGVSNAGTLTNASNTTITGGGTLALAGFTLTVPATGTAALLGTANVFTAAQTFTPSGGTATNAFAANGRCTIFADASGLSLRLFASGMYLGATGTSSLITFNASGTAKTVFWNDGSVWISDNTGSFALRNGATNLFSDASNQLDMRNGTSAQALKVYGTYTDSSNYVRASLTVTSTTAGIVVETLGTGADNIDLALTPAGTGLVAISSAASVDAAVVSTHTARMKYNGTEYKVLLATP